MSTDLDQALRELFGHEEPRDETGVLRAIRPLLRELRPSLLVLAEADGTPLAVDALDTSIDLTTAGLFQCAVDLDPGRAPLRVLPPLAELPSQIPYAVAFGHGEDRGVLAGLVRAVPDVADRLAELLPALQTAAAVARLALRAAMQCQRLETQNRHLRTELETLRAQHTSIISQIVDEHQQRLEEQAHRLALEEVYRAAQAANQAKTQFLANVSHELRTPLHGILSFAAFGMKKSQAAGCEELQQFFAKIERSGQALLALINDLLDLAKLESGRASYDFGPVDLRMLLFAVADEVSALAAQKRIRLVLPPAEAAVRVVADEAKLAQVARNLLSNAIKFSPPDSPVEMEIVRQQDSVQVRVCDRGIGVPESEHEAIFDKFIQSSKTRTGAGGTGLGLAICRQIITGHRGRIWISNRPGGGSVFTFEIPLVQPAAKNAAPALAGTPASGGPRS